MPLIPGVSAKAFKKFAKRVHRTWPATPSPLPLTQVQDVLSQALGYGPFALAGSQWARSDTAEPSAPEAVQEALAPLASAEDIPDETERPRSRCTPSQPYGTPWTEGEQQAWEALPRLFQQVDLANPASPLWSIDQVVERRDRLDCWSQADDLWRAGITAASDGVEALVAWAKAHPEADLYSVTGCEPWLSESVDLGTFFVNHGMLDWYEPLVREAGWSSFVGACNGLHPLAPYLWRHPQALRLLAIVPPSGVPDLVEELSCGLHGLNHPIDPDAENPRNWPLAQRRALVRPVLDAVAARLDPHDVRLQAAWDGLLDELQVFLDQTAPLSRSREIPLTAQELTAYQVLPKVVWADPNDRQRHRQSTAHYTASECQILPALVRAQLAGYAQLPPVWRGALEALEHCGWRDEADDPWATWLAQAGSSAGRLSGPLLAFDGTRTAPVALLEVIRTGSNPAAYVQWLAAGLPARRALGAEGLKAIWDSP